jgi:stage V sporulation protein G
MKFRIGGTQHSGGQQGNQMCCKRGGHLMEITDIKIRRIITEGRLRAVVSVTIDDMLAVHDIKVVQGDERLFVAMPSRKDENGVFRDIVHPISSEARKMMEEQILETYHRHLALMEAEAQEEAMQESAF